MSDIFFTQRNCDRCNDSLDGKPRRMSWFTEECLCPHCCAKEDELKKILRNKGINTNTLEGCGYVPTPNGKKGI